MKLQIWMAWAATALLASPSAAMAGQTGQQSPVAVVAWRGNDFAQSTVPGGLDSVIAIAAGYGHGLALKTDGTVMAWGNNSSSQCDVPLGLNGVIAIAAGDAPAETEVHNLALRADGTVAAWGQVLDGVSIVPASVPSNLREVIAVAAGAAHSLALIADGTVVAWGDNSSGQCNVPVGLNSVIAIAAGGFHSLALKANGIVVAWGDDSYGLNPVPSELNGVIAIAAGWSHSLSLKADGTVVAWGDNRSGQCNVPASLDGVIAIDAGADHNLSLKADGTVVAWGLNDFGQCNVPITLCGVIAIAAGYQSSLALVAEPANNGGPRIVNSPLDTAVTAGDKASMSVLVAGVPPLTYQWRKNGMEIPGATAATLTLNSVTAADSADYSVLVQNAYGRGESQPASLAVVDDGAHGTNPAQTKAAPAPVIEPEKDSLVVVTHGWEPPQPLADIQWLYDLREAIAARAPSNWAVVAYDWRLDAAALLPDVAILNAVSLGTEYGRELSQQHWARVHLVGHSAGAAFIEAVAKQLALQSSETIVHETFLDPYNGLFVLAGREVYGSNAHWADSYFSDDWTSSWTGGKLKNAYNVDVTWLDPNHKTSPVYCQSSTAESTPPTLKACGVRAYSPGLAAGHGWPYKFYTQTVTGEFPCAPDVGFALSQEADGWDKHSALGADNDPVPLCPDPDASSPPGTPKPDRVWKAIPIQDSPRGAHGSWEVNGNSAFALGAGTGHGLARGAMSARGVAPMDTPGGYATASWLAVAVTITNPVNFVQFDAGFTSPAGSEGLLTVYWNTNQIGLADERVTDPGLQNYRFALPAAVTNGLYTLSFRLDVFNATSSSVTVTNVTTGFYGLLEAPVLSLVSGETNDAPVLKVTAPAGYDCVVLNSTNLVDWVPAAVLVSTNGTAYYPLPTESAASAQFYRAVIP